MSEKHERAIEMVRHLTAEEGSGFSAEVVLHAVAAVILEAGIEPGDDVPPDTAECLTEAQEGH